MLCMEAPTRSDYEILNEITSACHLSTTFITQTPGHTGRARAKVYEESVSVALTEEPELVDGREDVSLGRVAFGYWS